MFRRAGRGRDRDGCFSLLLTVGHGADLGCSRPPRRSRQRRRRRRRNARRARALVACCASSASNGGGGGAIRRRVLWARARRLLRVARGERGGVVVARARSSRESNQSERRTIPRASTRTCVKMVRDEGGTLNLPTGCMLGPASLASRCALRHLALSLSRGEFDLSRSAVTYAVPARTPSRTLRTCWSGPRSVRGLRLSRVSSREPTS